MAEPCVDERRARLLDPAGRAERCRALTLRTLEPRAQPQRLGRISRRFLETASHVVRDGDAAEKERHLGIERAQPDRLYGVMLLERGMPKEALAAFEATWKKEPNRVGAYVGGASAAAKAGDGAKARDYYGKVVAIAANPDTTRTEVADARTFLAKQP